MNCVYAGEEPVRGRKKLGRKSFLVPKSDRSGGVCGEDPGRRKKEGNRAITGGDMARLRLKKV